MFVQFAETYAGRRFETPHGTFELDHEAIAELTTEQLEFMAQGSLLMRQIDRAPRPTEAQMEGGTHSGPPETRPVAEPRTEPEPDTDSEGEPNGVEADRPPDLAALDASALDELIAKAGDAPLPAGATTETLAQTAQEAQIAATQQAATELKKSSVRVPSKRSAQKAK